MASVKVSTNPVHRLLWNYVFPEIFGLQLDSFCLPRLAVATSSSSAVTARMVDTGAGVECLSPVKDAAWAWNVPPNPPSFSRRNKRSGKTELVSQDDSTVTVTENSQSPPLARAGRNLLEPISCVGLCDSVPPKKRTKRPSPSESPENSPKRRRCSGCPVAWILNPIPTCVDVDPIPSPAHVPLLHSQVPARGDRLPPITLLQSVISHRRSSEKLAPLRDLSPRRKAEVQPFGSFPSHAASGSSIAPTYVAAADLGESSDGPSATGHGKSENSQRCESAPAGKEDCCDAAVSSLQQIELEKIGASGNIRAHVRVNLRGRVKLQQFLSEATPVFVWAVELCVREFGLDVRLTSLDVHTRKAALSGMDNRQLRILEALMLRVQTRAGERNWQKMFCAPKQDSTRQGSPSIV